MRETDCGERERERNEEEEEEEVWQEKEWGRQRQREPERKGKPGEILTMQLRGTAEGRRDGGGPRLHGRTDSRDRQVGSGPRLNLAKGANLHQNSPHP